MNNYYAVFIVISSFENKPFTSEKTYTEAASHGMKVDFLR